MNFFLTNNIAESINHNLNSKFKNKYPSFNEWEKTILEECEKYFSKNTIMKRNDYTTKILIFIVKKLELNKNIDNLDLFKYDYIKKINRLIVPEHDSLSISPLSEILGLKDDFVI